VATTAYVCRLRLLVRARLGEIAAPTGKCRAGIIHRSRHERGRSPRRLDGHAEVRRWTVWVPALIESPVQLAFIAKGGVRQRLAMIASSRSVYVSFDARVTARNSGTPNFSRAATRPVPSTSREDEEVGRQPSSALRRPFGHDPATRAARPSRILRVEDRRHGRRGRWRSCRCR